MKQTIDISEIRYKGQVNDTVGDMLTRIRNASRALKDEVAMPSSKLLENISRILKREGYIDDYSVEQGNYTKVLVVKLKYTHDRKQVITGIRRMSKPGRREYANSQRLPKVLGGLGVAILSTSRGVMTSKEAAGHKVGGEVLCYVW
ncbi:MAG: rpsH [Thermoleophilia bacterium]|jgi:small subunit ribosomal protein S8|nr:rpsH [Thermoleophilia bacterium]